MDPDLTSPSKAGDSPSANIQKKKSNSPKPGGRTHSKSASTKTGNNVQASPESQPAGVTSPTRSKQRRSNPGSPPGSSQRSTNSEQRRGRMAAPAPNTRMPVAPTIVGIPPNRQQQQQQQQRPSNTAKQMRNPSSPNQRSSGAQQQRRAPPGGLNKARSEQMVAGQKGGTQAARRNSDPSDEAARAAMALAAVAQAASTSGKSPAEAAEIAKAQAHSISKKQQAAARRTLNRPEPRKLQTVSLSSVKNVLKQRLREEEAHYGENAITFPMLDKFTKNDNDAFLQHLLFMECLRGKDEDENKSSSSLDSQGSSSHGDDPKKETSKISYASDRVRLILRKVEMAYDSLHGMLPHVPDSEDYSNQNTGDDDYDTTVVVPDLLPPCTSLSGDPTLEFFRACMGDMFEQDAEKEQNESSSLSTDLDTSIDGESHKKDESKSESSHERSSSVFSNMFSMKRSTFNKRALSAVFGKKRKGGRFSDEGDESDENGEHSGEYTVQIEREMLGLTVENVLERTVVRTVLAGGPAKKAGARVGSLIVKVGNIETRNLTHFETIDELRQSQRPLQLVLRQISDDALRSAREEMGRLIRGAGFGRIIDGEPVPEKTGEGQSTGQEQPTARPLVGGDKNIDIYSTIVRNRWLEAASINPIQKKDEAILRVGEKLVWILTLFVVGLEREAARLAELEKAGEDLEQRSTHGQYNRTAKDYADAAKSVSKVLVDFVRKRFDPPKKAPETVVGGPMGGRHAVRGGPMARGGRGGRGRGRGRGPMVPGMTGGTPVPVENGGGNEKLLLQIGEVLQRTRTFLADPTSPPAALLRGELIACLCDILDADTDMELSEEENGASSAGGGKAGPITDLGSAGSLLKLIVLNCPIMRSPGCAYVSTHSKYLDPDELKRRFGEERELTTSDYHRLHAGNRFLAVVHRLAASRSTSARITACSLGPVLWGHLDFPHQLQLRGVITRALHDVEVIVRKSTATVLHEIAELVFDPRCVPWLVLMCERAMTDPEPLLRSAAMTLTWHLAEHLPNAFLGDASKGSRYLRRLPNRDDPIFADVYLLQCKLLPVATRLAEDRAPQVRLAVAAQCDRLCDALGDHWSSVIIDVLVALLTDSDERVRSEAVLCVPRLAEIVLLSSPPGVIPAGESSVLDALLPAAMKLQKDSSAAVRVSLATAAGEMLTLLVGLQQSAPPPIPNPDNPGRTSIRHQKRHVDDRLIPLVQKLLHDQDPEVTSSALRAVTNASRGASREIRPRFNTGDGDDDSKSLSSLQSHTSMEKKDPVFLPVLSEEQVLRLLPTLSELGNSKGWRVRQSAVEIVPALLGCTTQFKTRAEIASLCVRLCRDKVDAVRKTAAECLCLGGGSLGSHEEDVSGEWITVLVIPQIQACARDQDFKQRLLSLKMVEVILTNGVCPTKWKNEEANVEGGNTPLRELLKITIKLANDRIANVRLNVGRILHSVIHVFDEEETRVIKYALLDQLKTEQETEDRRDRDVIFFATKCLRRAEQKLEGESSSRPVSPEPEES